VCKLAVSSLPIPCQGWATVQVDGKARTGMKTNYSTPTVEQTAPHVKGVGVLVDTRSSSSSALLLDQLPGTLYVQVGRVDGKSEAGKTQSFVLLLTLQRMEKVSSIHANFRTGHVYCYCVAAVRVYAFPESVDLA